MSGICGILRFDGASVDASQIDAMLRSQAHLGPEGAFSLCDGRVGVGYRAMQVTQEDAFDSQPIASSDGVLLVADLRLDNREDLALDLGVDANRLTETADSALLLAAFQRWGEDCVDHLLGDFAFALWDAPARRLLLARDHMGQRRLFFHLGEGFVAFATEISAVWAAPDVPRKILEAGLEEFITKRWHRQPPGRTPFDGIESLSGGVLMTVSADGAISRRRYWEPHAAPIHLGRDEAYYRQAYREVLEEAVACRIRRAVRPCSLLLSGGFDSAAIAALARPALGPRKLITLTSALPDGTNLSPVTARYWVELCRRVMPHLDVRYTTRAGRSIFSTLPRSDADGAGSVTTYVNDELFGAAAAAGARVIMDGHGGDYTLNPRGRFPMTRLLAQGRLKELAAEFAAVARANQTPLWRTVLSNTVTAIAPGPLLRLVATLRAGEPLLVPRVPINLEFSRRVRPRDSTPLGDVLRPTIGSGVDLARALRRMQNQAQLAGRLWARHGLEFTQPFHDKRVVELALAIPDELHFRNGRPRYLARTALADVLPAEFQTRSWRNIPRIPDLLEMARMQEPRMLAEIDRLANIPKLTRYFDFARMRRMVQRPSAGVPHNSAVGRVRRGMRALILALYLETFLQDNA